jgi:hypothetical protein
MKHVHLQVDDSVYAALAAATLLVVVYAASGDPDGLVRSVVEGILRYLGNTSG